MPEDYIQSPPDSTGKKVHCKLVNDGLNDIFTPIHMLADRDDPTKRQAVNARSAAKVVFDNGSPDFTAFNRTTVSSSDLMGMYKFYQEDYALFFQKEEIGGGTVARDPANLAIKLSTSTLSGDRASYHSHRYYQYRPGNSMPLTFTMKTSDTGQTNLRRRIGWFGGDDTTRMCFESTVDGIYAVVEDDVLGYSSRTLITSWSHDRLDGSGGDNNLSGATLNQLKNNIWWIDFQFLGAGAISFGTYVDGEKVVCHVDGNYNQLDRPYVGDATFAFGIEQDNLGIVALDSSTFCFCAVITNEGYKEFDATVTSFSVSKSINSDVFVPLFSFQPKRLKNGVTNRDRVLPIAISIHADNAAIEVISEINSPLTGATWLGSIYNVEYDTVATSPAGFGLRKLTQFIGAGQAVTTELEKAFSEKTSGVTRHHNPETADHVTVFARLLSGTTATQVGVSINLKELQ